VHRSCSTGPGAPAIYAHRVLDADDADVVDDLGRAAEDHDDAGEPRSRPRPSWARSPWALPAVATAVVLIVGAAGLHQARAAAEADLARAQQLASLQLNVPSVFSTDRTPQHDARGRLLQQVQVQVYNAGAAAVRVIPLGTSFPAADLVRGEAPLSLDPASGSLLTFALAVDCSAVPPPAGLAAVTPTTDLDDAPAEVSWLQLEVETGGERTEQRYLLPGQAWGTDLGEQLAFACAPAEE